MVSTLTDGRALVHVLLISHSRGDPEILLVERESGIVEFPTVTLNRDEMIDDRAVTERIASETGLNVVVEGYLAGERELQVDTPRSRFLLARVVEGRPRLSTPHLGWEWRPATNLLARRFIPKLMVDELRSYMC